jgi:hypothetical protein
MPLITTPIPNLVGGVSQQPPAVRAYNEAQAIDNAVPSPVEGLVKRPPTEFVALVANAGGNGLFCNLTEPPFIHTIERDANERYFVIIQQDGTPTVYKNDGARQIVYIDPGVSLETASKTQRKALTVGDVTFISNLNTNTAAQNTLSTSNPTDYTRAGLVWIRQSNYSRKYALTLTTIETTPVVSSFTVTTGQSGKMGTNYVTKIFADGVVPVNPISASFTATVSQDLMTVSAMGTGSGAIVVGHELFGTNVIAGTTIVSFGTGTGGVGTYKVSVSHNINSATSMTTKEPQSTGTYSGPAGGIQAAGGNYSTSVHLDNVIYIKGGAKAFTATVEDDFAGDAIVFIRDQVERLEDLPPTAPHGYMVKVLGSAESDVDDYYVKFRADNGDFSRGVWEETVGPGVKYLWDYSKMPLLLIRQSDGSFMLKKADGTTPSTGNGRPSADSATVYNAFKWESRLVGDDNSNPFPSFLGYPIQDMVYHQSRLGFMSGENIVFSEVSEFFNFFRTSVLDVSDSDPIDIASSSPRIGKITAAVSFNSDLILFTPTTQMVLRSGDALSPRSVGILQVAEFENQASIIRPIPSANSVFFTFSNGGFTGMRELVPQPSLSGAYLANDLTNNVSRYIPSNVSHLAATTHENLAVVVANGDIYGYRYFNANNERVQSAWFRFTFQDSDANSYAFAKAIWAGFIESDLYVVMLRSRTNSTAYISIEKIRMGAGINDIAISGKNWITHLDQRKYYAAGQGSYNSSTGRTTFTLPKPMSYAAGKTKVVTLDGYTLSTVSGTAYSDPTAGTVVVAGDWSAKAVWIGTAYTMTYEFSAPYLKGSAGRGQAAIISGRYQLRYLTLQYADTSYFKATVAIDNEDTYEYLFTGEIAGLSLIGTTNVNTGTFRFPVFSKNDNLTIKIINDSPLPSKILSGEIEAFYNDRATRFGG